MFVEVKNYLTLPRSILAEIKDYRNDFVIKYIFGTFLLICVWCLFDINYKDNHFKGMKVTSVVSGLEYLKDMKYDAALKQTLIDAKPELKKWIMEFHQFDIIPSGFYSITIYNSATNQNTALYKFYLEGNKIVESESRIPFFNTGLIDLNDYNEGYITIKYPLSDYCYRVLFPVIFIYLIVMYCLLAFIVKRKEKIKYIEEIETAARFKSSVAISSGIAHNFRNDLQILLGQVKLIKKESYAKPPNRPYTRYNTLEKIEKIEEVVQNMTESINKLLNLTKIDTHRKPINIVAIIKDSIELFIQTELAKEVSITLSDNHHNNIYCLGRRQSYITVLMNIYNNAVQAMNPQQKKVIRIYLEVDSFNQIKGNDRLIIRIKDNGSGMSEEVKKHIFEPFFTVNKALGTGLGMSTTKSIIEQYNGQISVEYSDINKGSILRIDLPIVSVGGDTRSATEIASRKI